MAEAIVFDVLARDRASATFNKISQSTATMESRMSKVISTAKGLATVLVGAQVGRSVLAAADSFELSRSRLETITKNIGANFGALSGQVDATDKKMAALGFTSADTEGALATLEAVTKNPTRALKDLALAADIARGRNIGLNESVLILSRVETGHIAQLAKLGIATKDAAGNTLTQAEALQMLTTLYGGAASNYAGTFAGKQAVVAAELKNSAAQIGVALLPAAVDLAKVFQEDLLPPIIGTAHWLDENRKTIEPLAKAVLIGAIAWKTYTVAVKTAELFTKTFGVQAVATATKVEAAAVTEAAAAAKLSAGGAIGAGMAGGLTGRGVGAANALLSRGGALLGTGALIGGQFVGGRAGGVLSGAGGGALIGSALPGVGTVGGALVGAAISQLGQNGTHIDQGFLNQAAATKEGRTQLEAWAKSAGKIPLVGRNLRDMAQAALAAADHEKTLGIATQTTDVSLAAQTEKLVKNSQAMLNLSGAQDGLREAFHQAAQTAVDNGTALQGNSDAALANRDAIRNEAGALFSVIDAMKAHGANAAAVSQTLSVLTGVIETNAIKTYGDKTAVDALLASLGLVPGEISAVATAIAAMPGLTASLNSDRITKGTITQLQIADTTGAAAAKKSAQKIADSFTAGFTPVVAKGAAKAAKALSTAMDTAKQKMLADLSTIRDTLSSTQRQVASFADFSAQGTDALGASGRNSDVAGQLKAKAAQLKQFAALFTRLDRAHLDPHLMAQFASIGPDAIPAMQALLASGAKGISRVNRIEASIQHSAAQIARTEVKEQDAGLIHQDLLKLPAKFAREFAKDLKHLHLSVSLKESDWKNGKGVVVSP